MEAVLSKNYIKGFNNAYILAQHNPTLINKLLILENDNDYINGLEDGKKHMIWSNKKTRINDLRKLRGKGDIDLTKQ